MPKVIPVTSFKVVRNRLARVSDLLLKPRTNLNIKFLSMDNAQAVFAREELVKKQVLDLAADAPLVMGEVEGQIFVMAASQAQSLIENAVDQASLIEQLKP